MLLHEFSHELGQAQQWLEQWSAWAGAGLEDQLEEDDQEAAPRQQQDDDDEYGSGDDFIVDDVGVGGGSARRRSGRPGANDVPTAALRVRSLPTLAGREATIMIPSKQPAGWAFAWTNHASV